MFSSTYESNGRLSFRVQFWGAIADITLKSGTQEPESQDRCFYFINTRMYQSTKTYGWVLYDIYNNYTKIIIINAIPVLSSITNFV